MDVVPLPAYMILKAPTKETTNIKLLRQLISNCWWLFLGRKKTTESIGYYEICIIPINKFFHIKDCTSMILCTQISAILLTIIVKATMLCLNQYKESFAIKTPIVMKRMPSEWNLPIAKCPFFFYGVSPCFVLAVMHSRNFVVKRAIWTVVECSFYFQCTAALCSTMRGHNHYSAKLHLHQLVQ